jgi:hypothetical protein
VDKESRERQQSRNRRVSEAFNELWRSREEEVRWLYEALGWTQQKVAEYYDDHLRMVQVAMARLGIKSRPKGQRGAAHHNFKGGWHNRDYRKLVTKDRCRLCGATETLGIHHRNDDHFDNRLENLEVLCNSCHMSETKRKWWAAKKAGLPTPKSNGPVGWRRKPSSPQ